MATLLEVFRPWGSPATDAAASSRPEDDLVPDLLSNLTLGHLVRNLAGAMPPTPMRFPGRGLIVSHPSPLDSEEWLQVLAENTDTSVVLDRKGLTAKGGLFSEDHLFKSMARRGMLRDNRVLVTNSYGVAGRVYNAYALAQDVCGHKGIVHGGLSSAMIDETFGYVLYLAHKSQRLPELQLTSAMTAHLEVDYKKPVRAGSVAVCVAEIERVEGRKLWLKAELLDRPYSTVFATGKALFVVPRPAAAPAHEAQQQAEVVEGTEADV